jgi:catechol 2,3-dioxygenase-like lactoylglutathione lyase family enzyme
MAGADGRAEGAVSGALFLTERSATGAETQPEEAALATVRYIVDDVDEAVAFYSDHLGFVLARQFGPAIAIMKRDDLELWLAGPTASASRAMPDGVKPVPGGWSRFVLTVEDLGTMVGKMTARGVHFRNQIVSGPGGKQVLCLDPSGNVVELFEPSSSER